MSAPADRGQGSWTTPPTSRGQVPPVLWWARDFPGGKDQIGPARHWIEDLLPECEPLDDILLLASEVCTNAVVHTLSGKDGRFSVDVEWSPSLARVMIGDQGSLKAPAISSKKDGASWMDEYGRGLWLVSELAQAWGTATHLGGRSVWFDISWQARGGAPLEAPGGPEGMSASMALLRKAWPGTTVWWAPDRDLLGGPARGDRGQGPDQRRHPGRAYPCRRREVHGWQADRPSVTGHARRRVVRH